MSRCYPLSEREVHDGYEQAMAEGPSLSDSAQQQAYVSMQKINIKQIRRRKGLIEVALAIRREKERRREKQKNREREEEIIHEGC